MDIYKKDKELCRLILDDCEKIEKRMKGISYSGGYDLSDGICFRIEQIAENSSKLSDKFKRNSKEIPWREIKSMRNRLVHDYGNTDFKTVYDTAKNDMPNLHKLIKAALSVFEAKEDIDEME